MNAHPDVTIQVTGGGSGTGIAALIDGTTDICQASRAIKDAEKADLKMKRNLDAVETPVALDALAIYVHKDNSISSLTLEQVGKIYLGEITDWKDVGGKPGKIITYGRDNSSGTYVYFKEHVLANKDFPATYQALPGTGGVVSAVANDKNGIGYGGIGYATDLKTLSIAKDKGSMPVEPTMANVLSNAYPISRQLFWYTAGPPRGSDEGVGGLGCRTRGAKDRFREGLLSFERRVTLCEAARSCQSCLASLTGRTDISSAGRFLDRAAEILILAFASIAIAIILLIFVYVGREALPLLWDNVDGASIPGAFAPPLDWQPVSTNPRYNVIPLLLGTLKVTLIAMLIGTPLALAAALYTSEFAPAPHSRMDQTRRSSCWPGFLPWSWDSLR